MKVAYVISNINYSIAFEWIAEAFSHSSVELHFIFLNSEHPQLIKTLEKHGAKCYYIPYEGKVSLLRAFTKVFNYFLRHKIQVVHCHLFEANFIGLTAARLSGIKKRIYTRHHSSYHQDYFPKAVKYDKFINWLATDIIAISKNVEEVLIQNEKVDVNKITRIEHGFDLDAFKEINVGRVEGLRAKYQLPKNKKIIGVIARYIDWKGHQYITEAFQNLIQKRGDLHLLLANAGGPNNEKVQKRLKQLDKNSYTEIKFEEDLFALYKLMDVYVHVPINSKIEAFGQTYVEALASGIPSIFTISGISNDFISEENALIVDYKNAEQIEKGIQELLLNQSLRGKLILNGYESIQRFDKSYMINSLRNLYLHKR